MPSRRITDILNGRRSISADTAVRLGRYFGNRAQFWLDLQSHYDIAMVERERGTEIARRVRPADTQLKTSRQIGQALRLLLLFHRDSTGGIPEAP